MKELIPTVGMTVRPHGKVCRTPKKWEGIIVDVRQPDGDEHGCVAVWLKHRLNYGDDNCEHYAFYSHEQLATILVEVK